MTVDPAHDEDSTEDNDDWLWSAHQTLWLLLKSFTESKTFLFVLVAISFRANSALSLFTKGHSKHTCALETDEPNFNGLKCWGWNSGSQLGLGIPAPSIGGLPDQMGDNLPNIDIGIDAADIVQVATGQTHTCVVAIGATNGTKCFGSNLYGELGYGDTIERGGTPETMGSYLPFVDLGTNKALQVATGNGFTCALLYNFGLFKKVIKCWGRNTFGQLGLGHTSNQGNVPNDAFPSVDLGPGFEPVQVIVGVDRSCALSLSNSVKCWGRGSYGKLGYEDTLSRGTASSQMGINLLPISLGTGFNFNVIQIAIGEDHSCALSADNTVKCWGRNNFGQLGIGDTLTRGDSVGDMGNNLAPVQLGFDTIQITTGAFHSCALSNNNDVKCWGKNTGGQLGAGDTLNRGDGAIPMLSLIPIALGSAFGPPMHIEAGYSHVCAVSMFDKVKCWGGNTFGELGLEHTINMGVEPDDMADNLPVVDLVFIAPTPDPTDSPTKHPSINPTSNPSINPSFHPSNNPTIMPTNSPTRSPSVHPSTTPTASPSNNPTNIPSFHPSN
eukprot:505381_1